MKTKIYSLGIIILLIIACNKSNAQYAKKDLSNLTSPTAVNVNLLPDKDGKRNLGNINIAWKSLYLDSSVYLGGARFLAYKTGTGAGNTAVGGGSLNANTSGSTNTAVGYNSLFSNTTGYSNVAIGPSALKNNTSGFGLVAIGDSSLYNQNANTFDFYENTAIGSKTLYSNTLGTDNTATGTQALYANTTGYSNTAFGAFSLNSNIGGYENTAAGYYALGNNTTGYYNDAEGESAGSNVKTGAGNVFVGAFADCGIGGTLTNSTALGYEATVTSSNHVVIGSTSITSIGGYANWMNISDGRIKKNIKQNVPGLEFINKLQPITYNLDLDAADKIIDRPERKDKDGKVIQPSAVEITSRKAKEQIVYTGFIAQDVEKVAKSLNYDFSGFDKPDNANTLYGLRYSDFVVPLVKAVQELSKMNDNKDSIIQSQNSKINNLENRLAKIESILNVADKSTNNVQPQSINISSASLEQNVPNPFANSTTINYRLPKQFSSARIIITDKNGNTLKQINLPAGRQGPSNNKSSIIVDASTVSSGAYQYSLIIDGKLIDTKQMILSR